MTLADEVICYVMRIVTNNRLKLQDRVGILCLTNVTRWSGDVPRSRFEIHGPQPKVDVDLQLGTCSCRVWQLTGFPCKHACAAVSWKNEKPEEYCDGLLGLASYHAHLMDF